MNIFLWVFFGFFITVLAIGFIFIRKANRKPIFQSNLRIVKKTINEENNNDRTKI